MSRRILLLFIILLSFSSTLFAYAISDIKVKINDKNFTLEIPINKKDNVSVEESYYTNGVNLLLHKIKFDKISLKKFNSKLLSNIKIIPLENGDTLLKIQINDNFLPKKLKIIQEDSKLKIKYGEFPKPKPVIKQKPEPKPQSKEDKIIEELTKKAFEKPEINLPKPVIKKEKEKKPHFLTDTTSFTEKIIKTYSILAIMCIFLIGLAFLIKKFKLKTGVYFKDNNIFKIIYKFDVAPKKSIAIVKVYDEYLLVGITEYNINLLAKIESEDLKEEIKLIEGKRETSKFINYLKEKDKTKLSKESLINDIEEKIRRLRAR